MGRQMNLKEGFVSNMFASHPPMASRIAALKAMAFEHTSDQPHQQIAIGRRRSDR